MDRAGMSKNEYVGIDISQERLDVALCPLQQTFSPDISPIRRRNPV